ncbi:uncharacterized protein METZ01_LOCUS463596, partial [marine metagenome]
DNVDQEAHWESKSIDLEGKQNLYLSFHITEDGALDADDFVKVGYKLGNDDTVIVWEQHGEFDDVMVISPIPAHPDLKLIMKVKNDGSEKIYLEEAAATVIDHTDLSKGFSSFFLVKN